MPDYIGIDRDAAGFESAGSMALNSASAQDRQQATQYTYGNPDRSWYGAIGATIGLGAVDLADTVASSVPGIKSITGAQRGDVNNAFMTAVGGPGLMKFYKDNQGAIEVGSGIAGIIAADWVAGRVLKPASYAMKAARGVPFVRRLATLDKEYENARRLSQAVSYSIARRGGMGVEQFAGEVSMSRLGSAAITTSASEAKNAFRFAAVKRGLARNLTTEAVMATALNQNDFLYTEDMGENLAWMSVGVGLGAGIDLWRSRYALAQIANSDLVSRAFQGAYDVTGKENDRLKAALMQNAPELQDASQSWLGYGRGYISDRVTSMMVSARELANRVGETGPIKSILGKNREALQTPQLELAYEEANKITSHGIPGIPGTGFSYNSPGYGKAVMDGLYNEPAMLYGAENVGGANKELGVMGTHEERSNRLNSRLDSVLRDLQDGGRMVKRTRVVNGVKQKVDVFVPFKPEEKEALGKEYKQLVFHNSLSAHVMLEPGEWQPIEMGRVIEGYEPAKIIFEKTEGEGRLHGIWQRESQPGIPNLGIGHDGELYLPPKKQLHNLDFYDMLHLYSAADKMASEFASRGEVFTLPRKPNWFQLDLAENIIRKSKNNGLVQFPVGMNRETAQIESFAQKVETINKKAALVNQSVKKGKLPLDDAEAFKWRVHFNLPRVTPYQAGLMSEAEHPIEVLLNGVENGDQIRALSFAELKQGINEAGKVKGFNEFTPDQIDTMGSSFSFMKDRDGNAIEPIIAYKRPFAPFAWAQDQLAERMAVSKLVTRDTLTSADAGAMTKMLTQSVLNDENYRVASQVLGLQDAQIQSAIPGFMNAAPQTTRGSFLNSLVQKEWRDRDNPVLLAASRIRELQDRLVRDVMRQTITSSMGDILNRVNGPRAGASKLLLNQFFTHRTGWELAKDTKEIQLPNGQKALQFFLDHTSVANQSRFEKMFGRPLTEGQELIGPKGNALILDEIGVEALARFNSVSEQIRQEKNTLLRAQGLPEIKATPHYTPPPNTKGKYIGFTFDESDNLVPGGTIIASTPEEFSKLEAKLREADIFKPGFTFRTRERVTNFMDLWDKAQMDWMAPGTTAIQPGKKALGMTAGQDMNPNAWDEAMEWMRDSYLQHGADTMSTLFKDQLNAAKARSAVAGLESRAGVGKQDLRGRSIYDFYRENITGKSALSAPDSFFGEGMNYAERKGNALIREVTPHVAEVYGKLNDFFRRARPGHDTVSKEEFDSLSSALGPYMPYKDAAEMAERQLGATRPPELAAITGKMSQFEAAMRLRWFESMHAVVNLAGMVNTMPAVIRSMQRIAGETDEQYMKRIGRVGQIMELPDGRKLGIIDSAKIAYSSFKRAWSRDAHPYFDYMRNRGLLGQEVAEFHKQFGAIKTRGQLMGFIMGDAHAAPIEGGVKGALSKVTAPVARSGGLDHWLGLMSDKSEDFTRSWGMMAGLEVAEHLGIEGMERQVAFAHDVTNKMIANYDPRNRPEIFQGALGAPIGLFQTYIYNYYQRMFRYIETADNRALATQYAAQGAIFGINTLPGWRAVNNLFFDRGDEGTDPVESVHRRFGQQAGDLLMSGVLSNLPKLVGADGVNLYTRGDTQVRLPGVNPPPFFDTIKRAWQGMSEGIHAFSIAHPGTTMQELAEIASNMITNRPVAGVIEQVAGGYDTDRYGQVVAESRDLAEKVYRMLGVRSMTQQKELDAFYSNKNAQEQQAAQMTHLRVNTRAAIRAGDFDAIPDLFANYVENGGDPRRYNRWIKDAYEAAMATRGERQLDNVLKNPAKMSYVSRLLDAQVGVSDGEKETEDYGQQAEAETQNRFELDTLPELPPELQSPTRAEEGENLMTHDPTFQAGM